MKKSVFVLLAVFCLLLSGCGKGEDTPAAEIPTPPVTTAIPTAATAEPAAAEAATAAPAVTAEPSAAPTEAPEAAAAHAGPGTYTYTAADGVWTLTLRDSGPYTLQKAGDFPHTGESWAVNADGTVSCGPTDLWTEAFADGEGCTRWTLYADGRCEPVFPG